MSLLSTQWLIFWNLFNIFQLFSLIMILRSQAFKPQNVLKFGFKFRLPPILGCPLMLLMASFILYGFTFYFIAAPYYAYRAATNHIGVPYVPYLILIAVLCAIPKIRFMVEVTTTQDKGATEAVATKKKPNWPLILFHASPCIYMAYLLLLNLNSK